MYLNGAEQFEDFELIDSGDDYRLERWGAYTLTRPDPQVIWKRTEPSALWDAADAIYRASQWNMRTQLPEHWDMSFKDMKLRTRPMNFKHTGIFPEQAANWTLMSDALKGIEKPKVLNLFAYTGASTVWLTKRGAFVTHVDASRPAIGWAKENQELNGLTADSIRWMLEDAALFVHKEVKRGAQYDGIVMDPPAFGHGPTGKIWKFNEQMPKLLNDCVQLLSPDARFLIINAYATNTSELAIQNLLEDAMKGPTGKIWKFNEQMPKLLNDCVQLLSPDARFLIINAYATNTSELAIQNLLEDAMKGRAGTITAGQLCLKQRSGRMLSTGIFARWTK